MAKMTRLIFLSLMVRFTLVANRLIFLLKRLPIVGKKIPATAYGDDGLKIASIIFGVMSVMSKRLFIHIIYMVILFGAGMAFSQLDSFGGFTALINSTESFSGINFQNVLLYALTVWFLMSWASAPIVSITVSGENHKNNNMMVNYLRADQSIYAKSRILLDRTVDVLLFLPMLLLVFWVIGIPAWSAFATLIMFSSFRLAGEAFNMWMFAKVGKHCGDKPLSYWLAIPYYAAPIFIPYFFGYIDVVAFFANPLAVIVALGICITMAIIAVLYAKNYPLHMQLLKDKLHKYEVLFEKYQAAADGGATLAVAKKWDEGLETDNLEVDKFKNKKGFAYLNAIFFDRHKKFFAKKMRLRVLIILAPLAAAILLSVYALMSGGTSPVEILLATNGANATNLEGLFRFTPAFFFILSMASMGRIVTLSIFSNCDIHMLHYPYYRTAETILVSFRARFSAILRYNFIVTTVIFVSVIGTLTLAFGYMDLMSAAIFFVAITFIGAFFSFSDLFLYYVIQPYDSGGKDKSMLHKVINFAIGVLAWMSIDSNLDIELAELTIFVVIIVTLYIGIGTALLHWLAPKRFKLR